MSTKFVENLVDENTDPAKSVNQIKAPFHIA